MTTVDRLFSEYGESHQNKINKLVHWVCIPAIVFSLMGLLTAIPSGFMQHFFPELLRPYVNFATLFLFVTVVYYLRLSGMLALGMFLFAAFCIAGNVWLMQHVSLPLWLTSLVIFAIAWVGQFIGHQIEGKKPSFLKDLQFLMVGPAWLLHFLYKKVGIRY